ncbi:hypothetical protein [Blastococcus sp. SYSU DS0533]
MRSRPAAGDSRTTREGALAGGLHLDVAPIAIREDAVVGAGTVVTRDLPADVVAVGNPARVVRRLDDPAR